MKVIVKVIDSQVIGNRLLLLYYTVLFSLDYSNQFNLCHLSQKIDLFIEFDILSIIYQVKCVDLIIYNMMICISSFEAYSV